MKLPMYSISDRVSRTYSAPFTARNDQDAIRALSNLVNHPDSNDIFLHPEDFTLYKIGYFNDQHEEPQLLDPIIPVELIIHASALVANSNEESK